MSNKSRRKKINRKKKKRDGQFGNTKLSENIKGEKPDVEKVKPESRHYFQNPQS